MIKFAIHRSFFFQNALVEYIGVYTDTNKWVLLLSIQLFTPSDTKDQRKKSCSRSLCLGVNELYYVKQTNTIKGLLAISVAHG